MTKELELYESALVVMCFCEFCTLRGWGRDGMLKQQCLYEHLCWGPQGPPLPQCGHCVMEFALLSEPLPWVSELLLAASLTTRW